jgi:hypothetical protein
VLTPPGQARDRCAPILAAIDTHRDEIVEALRFLAAEADAGRIWSPRGQGTEQ